MSLVLSFVLASIMDTESDLSPLVQDYWREKGFCVHGEVKLYRSNIFIDHVAHLGSCEEPEYVVAIEMKKNAGKALRSQLAKLDTFHVAHELWGVSIATPRDSTVEAWEDFDRDGSPWWVTVRDPWIEPGLMSWEDGELHIHSESVLVSDKNICKRSGHLLLVEENCWQLGGTVSGSGSYCTHWSVSRERLWQWIQNTEDHFSTKDVYERLPDTMSLYKNPKKVARGILEAMSEDGLIKRDGRSGHFHRYLLLE